MVRLAVLASHPIQYKAPLYRRLDDESNIDLTVFYCSKHGIAPTDLGFGDEHAWDLPLLQGYDHEFLQNYSWRNKPGGFLSLINPGVLQRINNRFDALFIHAGYYSVTSLLAALRTELCNIPTLLHGTGHEQRPPEYMPSKSLQYIKTSYLRVFLQSIEAILADCSMNREYYESYGASPEDIYLMPAAVDNDKFRQLRTELDQTTVVDTREDLGIPADATVILFVGKLIKRKRPLDLIRAFERLDGAGEAYLLFVGDGELQAKLKDYCRKRDLDSVIFAGFQQQERLPIYYEMADVFVLPSAYDSSGKVVNEAMNFELPIVTTESVGVSKDLVQNNGETYPPGNVSALTNILMNLIIDPDRREEMGKLSVERISEWNFDRDVEVLQTVLNDLIRNDDES